MSSMREAVATKLDGITRYHDHMKQKRLGFLVRPAVLMIGWFVVISALLLSHFLVPVGLSFLLVLPFSA